ncbi:hypothetical protein GHT06_020501 [Daphnia sinensis]|uniref:Uncharacterized protein n=1 Tax=Daphnia sinensis TaxID=1820382 RepID=A0AAD5PMY4_9CRUS|nr:hypothetical protein GHT06_020501 [Daphnia sinensis]
MGRGRRRFLNDNKQQSGRSKRSIYRQVSRRAVKNLDLLVTENEYFQVPEHHNLEYFEANEHRSSDDSTVFEDVDVDRYFGTVNDDVDSLSSEKSETEDDQEEQVNFVINSSDIEESELSFRDKLASWAVLPGVRHVHVNKLLSLLRTYPCHSDLPADVRSLIGTPRIVALHGVHPGHYYHFGVVKGLKIVLNDVVRSSERMEFIDIFVNIDGLPISNSTGGQIWVILGSVQKPSDPNTFLKEFVREMKILITTGFTHCKDS